MKQLYLINHCNEWHNNVSFCFIGVVDGDHLESTIQEIKKECKYTDEDIEKYIDVNLVFLNDLDI